MSATRNELFQDDPSADIVFCDEFTGFQQISQAEMIAARADRWIEPRQPIAPTTDDDDPLEGVCLATLATPDAGLKLVLRDGSPFASPFERR